MKRNIAFFDFDGTITKTDTLWEVIKFHKGSLHLYMGIIANLPVLIAYKLKVLSNQRAKELVLRFFFNHCQLNVFQDNCDRFATTILPLIVRNSAINEINRLKSSGTEVVIVSASAENWIRKWADSLGIKLIATQLEVREGKITGHIQGKNCYGVEKVNRIKESFNLSEYDKIYCYGDSKGDKAMLLLGTNSFYKPFH